MESCVFCDHHKDKSPETFDREGIQHFFYFWDTFPATPGHLLIIPRRHVASFIELNTEELSELPHAILEAYKIIETTDLKAVYEKLISHFTNENSQAYLHKVLETLKERNGAPDGYNHGMNDGTAAGRTVPHLHYHIMPRWTGDVAEPKGGVRHMFTGKGNYQEGMQDD